MFRLCTAAWIFCLFAGAIDSRAAVIRDYEKSRMPNGHWHREMPGKRSNAWVDVRSTLEPHVPGRSFDPRYDERPPTVRRDLGIDPVQMDSIFKSPPSWVPRGTLVQQTFIPVFGLGELEAILERSSAPERESLRHALAGRDIHSPFLLKLERMEWKNLGEPQMLLKRWEASDLNQGSRGAEEIHRGLRTVFRESVLAMGGYAPETLDQLIRADLEALESGGFIYHFLIDPRQRDPARRAKFSVRALFKKHQLRPSEDFPFELFASDEAARLQSQLISSKLDPGTPLTFDGMDHASVMGFGRLARSPDLRSAYFGMDGFSQALVQILAQVSENRRTVWVDPDSKFIAYSDPTRASILVGKQGWTHVLEEPFSGESKETPLEYSLLQFLREFLRPHLRLLPGLKED